jgi:hypothetical protein
MIVHYENVATVINYYSEKIDLLHKIFVLILLLEIPQNSHLKLKKSLLDVPTI